MTSDKAPTEPTLFDLPLQEGHSVEQPTVGQSPSDPPANEPTDGPQYDPIDGPETSPAHSTTVDSRTAASPTPASPTAVDASAPVAGSPSATRPIDTGSVASAALRAASDGDHAPLLPFPEGREATEEAGAVPLADAPMLSAVWDEPTPEPKASLPKQPSLAMRKIRATAIDLGASIAICLVLVALTSLLSIEVSGRSWLGFVGFALPFSFLWQALPLGFWSATPGMRMTGLRTLDRSGRAPTFQQATGRWLAFIVGVATFGLASLPALWGRSLGDRWSSSTVQIAD